MYLRLHVKYPSLFSDLKLNFLDRFSKNIQILHSVTTRLLGAELFSADDRADGVAGQSW